MPPGTRLGRYEVIGELGTGGMATVYEGRALSVGGFARRVAIKYLHPHLLRDEQFVQMFMDEGRLAARIHHPNVVGVVDLVQEPHCMYMVSEFVEGDQLLALFKNAQNARARIPAPVTLRVMLDALSGLHAAHELTGDDGTPLRIVHRDVSPHNILVGSDGITRITDFGIAKAEERISTTRDGIVKGKLSYMAPEQPDELPVDRRADIFSAATVLWECLTGQRLFPGRTDREVLQALLHKPIPRLRDAAPELPESLDEVLARGLARSPDDRYTLAAEFAEAVEEAAKGVGVATPREVARYVEQNAARKLVAERERRRRVTTQDLPAYRPTTPSQVRAVDPTASSAPPPPPPAALRTTPGVGPSADAAEAPTKLSAPHVVLRSTRPEPDFDEPETVVNLGPPKLPTPKALPASPKPVPKPAASAPPVVARPAPRPPPRRRALALPLAVVLLGVALGYGVWRFLREDIAAAPVAAAPSDALRVTTTERALSSPEVPTPPPLPAAPPAVAPPVAAPVVAAPAVTPPTIAAPAVAAPPVAPPPPRAPAQPASTAARVVPRRPAPPPAGPTVTVAPTRPAPVTAPAPAAAAPATAAPPTTPRLPRHI